MLKLVQISDTHIMDNSQQLLFNTIDSSVLLSQLIKHINLIQPDYVIISGDLSQTGSIISYTRLQQLLNQLNCTNIYVLIGNHDNSENLRLALLNQRIRLLERLELGRWCIYGLNSQKVGSEAGFISHTQLEQLANSLQQQTSQQRAIIMLHHHFIPLNSAIDKSILENSADLIAILRQYAAKIAFCSNGHVHNGIITYCEQTPIYNCPASCVQFAIAPNFSLISSSGIRCFELHENSYIQNLVMLNNNFNESQLC